MMVARPVLYQPCTGESHMSVAGTVSKGSPFCLEPSKLLFGLLVTWAVLHGLRIASHAIVDGRHDYQCPDGRADVTQERAG